MSPERLVAGGIADRRSAAELARALVNVGGQAAVSQAGVLRVLSSERRYEFYGEPGEYVLADPCAETVAEVLSDLGSLVPMFEQAGVRCRFEVYEGEKMASYHHVNWPAEGSIER